MAGPRTLEIVQFGLGGVGRALFNLIVEHGPTIQQRTGLELRYRAVCDTKNALHIDLNSSLNRDYLRYLAARLGKRLQEGGEKLADQTGAVAKPGNVSIVATELERIKSDNSGARLVVVDVSGASDDEMTPALTAALRQGHYAVLANKRPLCGPLDDYKRMVAAAGPRLKYETTVGAALPVISTLQMLGNSFDTINRIEGAFSGTLGYLMTQLEAGVSYSQAVREAHQRGYTEPDPRDDLGGVDVARKALILGRALGYQLELRDVAVQPLYPAHLADISVSDFMQRVSELDVEYAQLSADARANSQTLRYLATVADGQCRVGLEKVALDSQAGRLRGTDNIVIFHTRRYNPEPMVIQGHGAGPEVTASGVLADIVSFA